MPPERGVGPIEIELAFGGFREREEFRFVAIVFVGFWEDAEPDFVERRRGQGLEGLFLEFTRLMHPSITGGAELVIGCAIGITQVERVEYLDRTVIAGGRRGDGEGAVLIVELGTRRTGLVTPFACAWGTKADAISITTIPESGHNNALCPLAESGGPLNVQVWITGNRPLEGDFMLAPLLGRRRGKE